MKNWKPKEVTKALLDNKKKVVLVVGGKAVQLERIVVDVKEDVIMLHGTAVK